MPLTDGDFVQEDSGSTGITSSTSVAATLPSGTTAGNTVVVVLAPAAGSATPPAGFVSAGVSGPMAVYYKSNVAAAETSWTFTGSSQTWSWYAAEVSGMDLTAPVDVTATNSNAGLGNGGTLSTGTTSLSAGLNTVAIAAWMGDAAAGVTNSWSAQTNDFVEAVDVGGGGAGGVQLAVAKKFQVGTSSTFSSTATFATSGGTVNARSIVVVFRAADSPVVAPLAHFLGFEWGTHGGASATGATSMFGGVTAPTGTWGTAYLIQAGSARNSSYGLRIAQSAAAANVKVGALSPSSVAASVGFNVRVVSATGTVVVASLTDAAQSVRAQLLYDSSATKFGVRCGTTGTAQWESGTTALSTWRWVDLRFTAVDATWRAEWRIETAANTYTDQTAATLGGQGAGSTLTMLLLGSPTVTSQTASMDFDDVCFSRHYVAYPLGPHQIRLITVDPAGTPSVSGTSSNFSVFTANGTLAAWNATNARNALDEAPPTISASADGVCQTAVAASDYMEFPMATYTCAADEYVNGVRMLAPAWGGTGTGTGTLGIRGHDGTTETTLIDTSVSYDADSLTALSSTHPRWECAYWPSTNGWTQAELNAAAVRVGFSTDATPDMGVHAVYLEAAIGKTRTSGLFGDLASIEIDPTRLGAVSITVDAPAGVDTNVTYEVGGSPTTMTVPGGTTDTDQINAVFEPDVNYISGETEAEPDPVD